MQCIITQLAAVLVIGNQWLDDRQRFTLAHELGHLVLQGVFHPKLDEEKYCDHFAGAFLLPKEALITMLGDRTAVNKHLKNIYSEGNREVTREVEYYNKRH